MVLVGHVYQVDAGIYIIQGQGSTGLPGNYKIGAYVDSNGYPDLSSLAQAEIRGNYGFYDHGDRGAVPGR